MSMLGLIHRVVLGEAPRNFEAYFKRASNASFRRGWPHHGDRHEKQLVDPIDGTHSHAMERSVFGLIYFYNVLPKHVISAPSIKLFQRMLQQGHCDIYIHCGWVYAEQPLCA